MSITLTTLKMKAGYNILARLLEMLVETGSKPEFGSSTLKALGMEENKGMAADVNIFSEFKAFHDLPAVSRPSFSAKFISVNPLKVLKENKDFSLAELEVIAGKILEVHQNISELYTLIGAPKPEKSTGKTAERTMPEPLDGVPFEETPAPAPEEKPEETPAPAPAKAGKK